MSKAHLKLLSAEATAVTEKNLFNLKKNLIYNQAQVMPSYPLVDANFVMASLFNSSMCVVITF
jgi:hypothetical protein